MRGAVARAPHKHLPRGVANVYQLLMQAPNNINTMAVNSHVVSALEVMPRDAVSTRHLKCVMFHLFAACGCLLLEMVRSKQRKQCLCHRT